MVLKCIMDGLLRICDVFSISVFDRHYMDTVGVVVIQHKDILVS